MTSLGYVYVIENKRKKEKQQLEAATTAPKHKDMGLSNQTS